MWISLKNRGLVAARLTLADLDGQEDDGNHGEQEELVLGEAKVVLICQILGETGLLLDLVAGANLALSVRHRDGDRRGCTKLLEGLAAVLD